VSSGEAVSGRISALAIANTHIQQVPTLFLGAAGGGVWTSISFTGDNPSYTPETDNLSITNADSGLGAGAIDVGSIAVDPNDTIGTIYVGTGEANGYGGSDSRYGTGILKSTDGGNTFKLIATGTAASPQAFFRHAISKIIVDPRNSKNLYAAVVSVPSANGGMPNGANQDDGIYRSQDAGATWVKITSGPQRGPQIGNIINVTDMDYTWNKATNSLTLFAGVADGGNKEGGIWRSTDDGASWGQIGNTTGTIRTSDSEAVHPSDVWRVALAADHTSGGTNIFAVIIKPGGSVLDVFKAWTGDGRNWRGFGPGNFTGDQGTYDVAIGLSPTKRLYVAGQDKVFESADLAHWQNITTGGPGSKNPHTDDHAFAFTPDGKVYLGTDGGRWRYNPAPAGVGTWDDLNTKWLQTHQL
jgi:hypothetical protein